MKRNRLPPDTRPKWHEVPEHNIERQHHAKKRLASNNSLAWHKDASYRWAYSRRKVDQELEELGL